MITKAEFDKMIENGVTAPAARAVGAYRIGFYPFELLQTQEEINLTCDLKRAKHDYDDIVTTKDTIEHLLEERFTQTYRGIKYYFETGDALKRFCDMLESNN